MNSQNKIRNVTFVCLLSLLFVLSDGAVSEFPGHSLARAPGRWYFPCVPPAWRTSKVVHCGQKVKTNTDFRTLKPHPRLKMPPVRLRPRLPTPREARGTGREGDPASGLCLCSRNCGCFTHISFCQGVRYLGFWPPGSYEIFEFSSREEHLFTDIFYDSVIKSASSPSGP